MQVTVRIMNSYDYGHFEITLTENDVECLDVVDSLRQQAQTLVRDAIADYKEIVRKEQEEMNRKYREAIERGEVPF